jgi:2-polyprenyl-6-methoxyphenol hydroxylase-like FAD-dependent oxidoreductase
MATPFDAIVIGARCAGSPTAMLLSRLGYRVLLVDRASFPSDTVSTHIVQPLAAAALERWGLLDALRATGCPPIRTYAYDFGALTIQGTPGNADAQNAFCPRRTVLDKLLVDAAVAAGAELRERVIVDSLLWEKGRVVGIQGHTQSGTPITEHATVVVGADGWHSLVAYSGQAPRYHEKPTLLATYYSYWSNLPVADRFEIYIRPRRGFAAAATHDGLTLIVGGWPYSEFAANKYDVEGHFTKMLEQIPEFAERLHRAHREARFAGANVPNYFRKPYGPGWVLVGDAGYIKDPITAQGINDAFRDAEQCTVALDHVFTGARSFDDAMSEYQRRRDEHVLPMYEFTCQIAAMEPPSPTMQELFRAISRSQTAMDGFAQVNAGTISPAQFFSPESIGAIMAGNPPPQ